MAETVGALILASIEAAGVAGATTAGTFAIAGTGITLNAIVGTAAIAAASIGLSYALRVTPDVPKPESGSQAVKQSIPPRIRGYWVNRISGTYMFFEAADSGGPPANSYDVVAFHHGKIESVVAMYLSDDQITISSGLSAPPFDSSGQILGVVDEISGGAYGSGKVTLQLRQGLDSQNPLTYSVDPAISGLWTSAFKGNGIAYAGLACAGASDPSVHTQIFPRGRPEFSIVARCAPIWDPRDGTQSRTDKSTWKASPNPVLQLIDYLTGDQENTGGPGLDYETLIAPVLDQWIIEAALCDDNVGGISRYESAGWYQFDNKPEDVIGKILATCDGYLMENGDGTLSITVGYYRQPTEPALTPAHILGFSVDYGTADESRINQLDVTITDPAEKYISAQIEPVRAEDSISLFGLRGQPLDLTWVQERAQAQRLAHRALQRLNAPMSGTLVTTLYGFRYFGKRWMPLQYPTIAGLEDCVVEIQSVKTDLLNGRITFEWKKIDPAGYAEFVALPKMFREDSVSPLLREDGSAYTRETA